MDGPESLLINVDSERDYLTLDYKERGQVAELERIFSPGVATAELKDTGRSELTRKPCLLPKTRVATFHRQLPAKERKGPDVERVETPLLLGCGNRPAYK